MLLLVWRGFMRGVFKTIGRSIFPRGRSGNPGSIRLWPAVAIATFLLGLAGVSAQNQNQEQFYTFESVLSTANANWCIDIPGGQYHSGSQLAIASCTGAPNQTFGAAGDGTLTA